HRMPVERESAPDAAAEYERDLERWFELPPGAAPRFDFVFLGMGADGHTASLFPGTAACDETRRLVVAQYVEKVGMNRLTLTYPVLNNARRVAFLVSGNEKSHALAKVLDGDTTLPAARVEPSDG